MQPRSWNEFVDHFVSALSRVVPLQSFFAYQVELPSTTPSLNAYYSKNISEHSIGRYLNDMCQYDPINVLNQPKNQSSIIQLKHQDIPEPYYHFLKDNHVLDNIELVFKPDQRSYVGISLIRSDNEQVFNTQEIQIIKSCYDLAQYNTKQPLNTDAKFELSEEITQLLTRSERQVLNLILTSKKNQEIADALFVSLATVKTHIHHIFQKTMVKSKRELILKALKIQ